MPTHSAAASSTITVTTTASAQPALRVVHQPDLPVQPKRTAPVHATSLSVETSVTGESAAALYRIYVAAFLPLWEKAALDHLLSEAEFAAVLTDPTIMKIVAWDDVDAPMGLATLSTNLGTEHISSAFYANRFADEIARGQLFYLGFLLVRPDAQRGGVFADLVEVIVQQVSSAGGVVAFDICKYNDETFRFARMCALMAGRIRPAELEVLDVQTYYAVAFPATTGDRARNASAAASAGIGRP